MTLHNLWLYTILYLIFFLIIILITQTYKTKNIAITRYYLFPLPGKKEKNELKQSEIKVKTIIKLKKHNICSNWQIVFMNDTDKQTLIDIYEILIVKNLKEVHQIF